MQAKAAWRVQIQFSPVSGNKTLRGAHCGYFSHEPDKCRDTSVASWRILLAKLEHPRSGRAQPRPPGARDAKQALIPAQLWHGHRPFTTTQLMSSQQVFRNGEG
eukprot:5610717-Pleurochrysis_carterae.AAC.4